MVGMTRAAGILALVVFATACESTPEVRPVDAMSSARATAGRYTLAERAAEQPPAGELELRRDGSFALDFHWPSPEAITFGSMIGEPGTMTGKWVGDLGDEGLVHLFVHRDPDASDLVLLTYLDGATFHLPQRVVSAVPCGTHSHRLSR